MKLSWVKTNYFRFPSERPESSHGQTFDPLHFGYTFSTVLGRQIKGRGRGHQPFLNKMKYHWPKVLV